MEMRRGGGEVSRQNGRADRCCEGSSSAWFSEARRDVPPKRPRGSPHQIRLICLFPKQGAAGGGGGVSSPDWRTRMQRAQKRAGRGVGRRKQVRVLGGVARRARAREAHERECLLCEDEAGALEKRTRVLVRGLDRERESSVWKVHGVEGAHCGKRTREFCAWTWESERVLGESGRVEKRTSEYL